MSNISGGGGDMRPVLSGCCKSILELYFPSLTYSYWRCNKCGETTDSLGNPTNSPTVNSGVLASNADQPASSTNTFVTSVLNDLLTLQGKEIDKLTKRNAKMLDLINGCSGMLKLLVRDRDKGTITIVVEQLDKIEELRNEIKSDFSIKS